MLTGQGATPYHGNQGVKFTVFAFLPICSAKVLSVQSENGLKQQNMLLRYSGRWQAASFHLQGVSFFILYLSSHDIIFFTVTYISFCVGVSYRVERSGAKEVEVKFLYASEEKLAQSNINLFSLNHRL